jgi:hypothetical protein
VALEKILRPEPNEDGSPHYLYRSDGPVVITGPITGYVTVPDGTIYNVSDAVVEVAPGHEDHVAHAIALRYESEGHPLHRDPDVPFQYERPADAAKRGLKG